MDESCTDATLSETRGHPNIKRTRKTVLLFCFYSSQNEKTQSNNIRQLKMIRTLWLFLRLDAEFHRR